MAQVDIGFDVQLSGKGLTDLEKLQKTLEEIEKKSKIKLPTNSDNGGVETAKEKNKLDTIAIQNLQLRQKLIEAENKGYAETQNKLQKLMDINEGLNGQAEVITQKQWGELKLIEKKESSIRKQKEEEIRLTQEVNKALLENKKVSDSVLKEKTQQQSSDQYGGFSKSKELEDMKKFYKEQDKENKKAQKLELQRFNQNLQLRQKLIEAENKGYAETQNKLQKLMDINEGLNGQAEVITQKQWGELKLIEKKESSIRKQKEEEIRLTQEVNKALLENKKVSDSVLKEKTQQQSSDQYGGFSKSKELEDMKKFYKEQDKENKKAQELELQRFNQNLKAKQGALIQKQKEEYDAIGRQQSLKDRLYSTETDMIRNNLSRERYLKEGEVQKSFQDKLKELQNNKNSREQDLKEFEKYMKRASAINQVNRSNFTSDISQLMVVRQMKANFERTVLTMEKFEDAVYQAGIIGGKTGVEIRQLRNEMTQLGMEIPRATQEIVEQIGSVARTGRTFEEAVKIVTNASNLAIVSGESLADSVNVLNKVMVAFDINIANTAKTMDILHSATLTTPLDLRAIADGMKNSASAMRNFIENTNKSGEELEDYKTTLLELNTALLGNQMSLG